MKRYDNKSNYALTSVNKKYLDLYQPPLTIENLTEETTTLIIQPKYNKRPDLLAFDMYGSSRLWWVFAHYNRDKLTDPIMDFISGTRIVVPKNYRPTGTN
jgi:hypothetical protein|tara:strand:- start:29284 stop:29583 length:300 start_codon:yes stop_codon:yes gene_type:complete